MNIKDTQKTQLIGYLFLIGVTCLEVVVFKNIFGIGLFVPKMIGVILTPALFNLTIWCIAIRYHRTKRRCIE